MKYKKITDKQLEYILSRVIGPQLEYLMQLTTFTETQCNQFSSPFRRLFKHKLRLAATAPNYITDCQFLCNSLSVYNLQLLSHVSKFHKQVNNSGLLGRITSILARQLQSDLWLPSSPLIHWSFPYQRRFGSSLLASTLSIMQPLQLSFNSINLPKHFVLGGDFPLVDILGPLYIKPSTQYRLKKNSFMFLSQFTTLNGQFLLKWADFRITDDKASHSKPRWYSIIERRTLQDRFHSRRLKLNYNTPSKPLPNPLHIPDMTRKRVREWVTVYNPTAQAVIIGRVHNKSAYANSVIIQHWLHWIDNDTVSPSYLQTVVQPCPGCNLHDLNYASINASRDLTCSALYSSHHPVNFDQCRRLATDKYILLPSLYYLKQLAHNHYEQQANPTFVSPTLPRPIQLTDNITQNIFSIRKRHEITSLRSDFASA